MWKSIFWYLAAFVGAIWGLTAIGFWGFIWGFLVSMWAFLWAGGWFVGESLTLGALVMGGLLFVIPSFFIGALTEWGDPRASWWWENGEHEPSTHEVVTSVLCISMLFVLNWGGVPIWATMKAHPWYSSVGYLGVGFVWMLFKKWDDFSHYLHMKRTETLKEHLAQARDYLELFRTHRQKLRSAEAKKGTESTINASVREQTQRTDLRDNDKTYTSQVRKDLLCEELTDPLKEITDTEINAWIEGLTQKSDKEINVSPAFEKYLAQKEAHTPKVSAADYKEQLYLWMFFWPWSMAHWVVRKIVTLRILHDLFNVIFNWCRVLFDYVADRHATKIVIGTEDSEAAVSGEKR